MNRQIQVLIVDDSAVVRQVYRSILEGAGIGVLATANDPFEAVRFISKAVPDVMIVDVEMPRMDGITFLRKIMQQCPIATIVCSSYTAAASGRAFEAAQAGAVEVLEKPKDLVNNDDFAARLCEAVRAASIARPVVTPATVRATRSEERRLRAGEVSRTVGAVTSTKASVGSERRPVKPAALVAIGASTGGTEAIRRVLSTLPATLPPIVIVQHMPVGFTAGFADWLDKCCPLAVSEAIDGQPLATGQAVIAKGGFHLRIRRRYGRLTTVVSDDAPVNRHRPSVDALFDSVVTELGAHAHAVLLTGMGDDGAAGLLRLRNAGAITIAESEESAVVFGMPKEAIARGAASMILGLSEISSFLGSVQSDEVI
jgi:two-component system chemotaxis response regulator CheB